MQRCNMRRTDRGHGSRIGNVCVAYVRNPLVGLDKTTRGERGPIFLAVESPEDTLGLSGVPGEGLSGAPFSRRLSETRQSLGS